MCGLIAYQGQKRETLEKIRDHFNLIKHRGPDNSQSLTLPEGFLGFHRLSIMDLSPQGHQPMQSQSGDTVLVCNGEIYNHRSIRSELTYKYKSQSDCEVILALYQEHGLEKTLQSLDGEFAFVILDRKKNVFIAARDPIGIRPLFYGYTKDREILFASEMKVLHDICEDIKAFPPAHFYDGHHFKPYCDPGLVEEYWSGTEDEITTEIRDKLVKAVEKRLNADVSVGFLLSGGLDSSLVCSIAQRASSTPIKTFAIGMEKDAIDLKYAKQVADFLGTNHTEVIISKEDVINALEKTIWHLETWDITTIRASLGMYLLCEYISKNTTVKVLLTGEVSDELFGYKYTDFAPSAAAFQDEAAKRIRELYMYDVLRADRCISAHSLEARVPFSDQDFVNLVMKIHPDKKLNSYNMGKYLLRKAFATGEYLPESILYRDKAAFSDAVGHSLVDEVKKYAAEQYKGQHLEDIKLDISQPKPKSFEALLYLEIFLKMFPKRENLISDYWLPNKEWEHCDLQDPSARFLPNYGKSGI